MNFSFKRGAGPSHPHRIIIALSYKRPLLTWSGLDAVSIRTGTRAIRSGRGRPRAAISDIYFCMSSCRLFLSLLPCHRPRNTHPVGTYSRASSLQKCSSTASFGSMPFSQPYALDLGIRTNRTDSIPLEVKKAWEVLLVPLPQTYLRHLVSVKELQPLTFSSSVLFPETLGSSVVLIFV